jgi:hypothetical protein
MGSTKSWRGPGRRCEVAKSELTAIRLHQQEVGPQVDNYVTLCGRGVSGLWCHATNVGHLYEGLLCHLRETHIDLTPM